MLRPEDSCRLECVEAAHAWSWRNASKWNLIWCFCLCLPGGLSVKDAEPAVGVGWSAPGRRCCCWFVRLWGSSTRPSGPWGTRCPGRVREPTAATADATEVRADVPHSLVSKINQKTFPEGERRAEDTNTSLVCSFYWNQTKKVWKIPHKFNKSDCFAIILHFISINLLPKHRCLPAQVSQLRSRFPLQSSPHQQ